MSEKQIIVFETTDIFNIKGIGDADGPVVGSFFDQHDQKTYELATTGVLEKALELGCEVFVASTRAHLTENDKWWVSMLKEHGFNTSHLFLVDVVEDGRDDSSSGWRRLFLHLNIEWPTEDLGDGPQPMFWTSACHVLEENGVLLACTLRKRERKS